MGWRLREKHATLRLHLCVGMICVRLPVQSVCVCARARVSVSVFVCVCHVGRTGERNVYIVHTKYDALDCACHTREDMM